jgi:hypothetical protein
MKNFRALLAHGAIANEAQMMKSIRENVRTKIEKYNNVKSSNEYTAHFLIDWPRLSIKLPLNIVEASEYFYKIHPDLDVFLGVTFRAWLKAGWTCYYFTSSEGYHHAYFVVCAEGGIDKCPACVAEKRDLEKRVTPGSTIVWKEIKMTDNHDQQGSDPDDVVDDGEEAGGVQSPNKKRRTTAKK